MPEKLKLRIVTPYRQLFEQEVSEVSLPGELGEIGILPGHTALMSTLGIGELRYRGDGKEHSLVVAGGFVEVDGDEVTVLAETGELAGEIDSARAQAAKERAEKELTHVERLSEGDFEQLRAALQRALIRLQVGEKE